MNMDLTNILTGLNRHYLRQYAALQFPCSVENQSTVSPLHLLQQEREVGLERRYSIYNAQVGDKFTLCGIVDSDDYYTNIEDVVKRWLDIDGLDEFDIEDWSVFAKMRGETPFLTFEESGCRSIVDYLELYGVNIDEVDAFEPITEWNTMAVAFSKRELKRVEKDMENHIFDKTRIYSAAGMSFDRTSGDYYMMMDTLLRLGTALLKEMTIEEGITVINGVILSKNEIISKLKETPKEDFCVASYTVTDCEDVRTMRVWMNGEMMSTGKSEFTVAKRYIAVYDGYDGNVEVGRYAYAFGDDRYCDCLRDEKPLFDGDPFRPGERLYLYCKFADGIKKEEK